jgi:RimJ/RimL family protein N-acetyltransferase
MDDGRLVGHETPPATMVGPSDACGPYDDAAMGHPLWPLFDLRLRTERLELRLPREEELIGVAALAKAGIHPPDEMPFGIAWTAIPSPEWEHGFLRYHWTKRSTWSPEDWTLDLMVSTAAGPIGMQGLMGRDFAHLRLVRTGSWLGQPHQGQGYGKEMRGAVLALAFDGLRAEVAESEACLDNLPSAGVSRSLGYAPNGIGRLAPQGIARDTQRYRMTHDDWTARPRPTVTIEGLEGCLDLFGASAEHHPRHH